MMYHVAPERVRASIAEHGIDPPRFGEAMGGEWERYEPERPGGFFLFDNLEQARWYAQYMSSPPDPEPMDIWEVEVDPATRLMPDDTLIISSGDPDDDLNAGSWYHPGTARAKLYQGA